MKLPLITLALGILASSIFGDALAEIYKWVDENGVVNHSYLPPPDKPSTIVNDNSTKLERQTAVEDLFSYDLGHKISGVVQDSNGNPLPGVTMTVIMESTNPNNMETKRTKVTQNLDGAFSYSCQKCPIKKLRFTASGYESKTVPIRLTKQEEKLVWQNVTDKWVGKKTQAESTLSTITRDNLVVVLEKESASPRYNVIRGQVSLTKEGPMRILVGEPPDLRMNVYHAINKTSNTKNDKKNTAIILPSLSTSTSKQLLKEEDSHQLSRLSHPFHIELTNAEGGFVTVKPTESVFKEKLQNMRLAPEYGYKKMISVKMNASHGDSVFFYCKIGEFYGKGYMTSPKTEKGGGLELVSHIEIEMNTEGGRNLNF